MNKTKEILSWVIPILVGFAIAMVIKTFWITTVRVDGSSMYPNLQNNERIVELKTASIKRNSVVIFNAYGVDKRPGVAKSTQYVKRVIGMPGDQIEYKSNGQLYVNGHCQSQSYISKKEQTSGTLDLQLPAAKDVTLGTGHIFTVPKDEYFVLGDHRSVSNDSRYYGFVKRSKITGVAKVFFWNKKKSVINSYPQ